MNVGHEQQAAIISTVWARWLSQCLLVLSAVSLGVRSLGLQQWPGCPDSQDTGLHPFPCVFTLLWAPSLIYDVSALMMLGTAPTPSSREPLFINIHLDPTWVYQLNLSNLALGPYKFIRICDRYKQSYSYFHNQDIRTLTSPQNLPSSTSLWLTPPAYIQRLETTSPFSVSMICLF